MNYHQEVWSIAVRTAEDELMRLTPTLCGGRTEKETPEAYLERSRTHQERALKRLRWARAGLAAAAKWKQP